MSRRNRAKPPRHPGRILLEEFLRPRGVTQAEFAARIDLPAPSLSLLVTGKRGITARTAWKLAMGLGTRPDYWMDRQAEYDLWDHRPQQASPFSLGGAAKGTQNTKSRRSRPAKLSAEREEEGRDAAG